MVNTMITTIKESSPKDKIIIIMVAIIIIAAGLFSINQYASFKFKTTLIQQPCNLCAEKYPSVKECILTAPMTDLLNITNINIMP